MGYFTKWARFFNLGNVGRAVYEKPLGPNANPVNSVFGSAGIPVIRTMYSLKPSIALPGNTLVLNSTTGIASSELVEGSRLSDLQAQHLTLVGVVAGGLSNQGMP